MMKVVLALGIVVALAGCGISTISSPVATAPPTPTSTAASSGPPSASSSATAFPSASTTPGSQTCLVPPQDGALTSNQLISVDVAGGPTSDRVTFTFGPPAPEPTTPRGHLREVTPPIREGASGNEIKVDGQRFVEVKFDGLYLFDAAGNPAFKGSQDLHPNQAAIRQVVATEEFEGVFTWVVGFNGPGCVTLGGDSAARTVTLDVTHGPA